MDEFDVVCVEIGSRGHLSRADAKRAAVTWKKAQRAQPGARFIFAIAGHAADPRALWEIPEAAAYVREWAELVGITDPETGERMFRPADDRMRGNTVGLLDLCACSAIGPGQTFVRCRQAYP